MFYVDGIGVSSDGIPRIGFSSTFSIPFVRSAMTKNKHSSQRPHRSERNSLKKLHEMKDSAEAAAKDTAEKKEFDSLVDVLARMYDFRNSI